MRLPIQHIECFHLVLLRMLEARLDRATWVVKGGVNLRAWFGSLRYSEDLDIDIVRGGPHSLREKVDRVLAAAAFREMLAAQGLELTRSSKPKQTDTTQRWKFELRADGLSLPLHTRIEFSRRGSLEDYTLEPARPEIVRPYGLSPPTANHYAARSAVRQKIEALASRAETQARDVWDLEHLLRTTDASPGPLVPAQRKTVAAALERAMGLSFSVFKSQVVPYLAPDHQDIYGTADAWERISDLVVERALRVRVVTIAATEALGRLRRMGKPVVTSGDTALLLGQSRSAATRTLGRLAAAGLVLSLRHGLWSLDPRVDPLLLPEYLTAPFPSYVSLLSALHVHGMISQVPHLIYVASLASTKRVKTSIAEYSIHRLAPSFFGGFETVAGGIRLASPEKALLDSLYLAPGRSRLFTALPEVEIPRHFRREEANRWLRRIPHGPRRILVQRRLRALLERAL